MREPTRHLDGLTLLHRIPDTESRLAAFRQAMATLGVQSVEHGAVPLEGVDPHELASSIRVALDIGLIDDLGWLSPAHAAAALHELGGALPMGDERKELGRRVLRRMHEGNAATFITLATRLASTSRRALTGPAVHARVALALSLPISSGVRADELALSLVARPELGREWLVTPSTGALPSRRLAARLLELAARETLRRVPQQGSDVLALFETSLIQPASARLLADRESLVWRHVAVARGLLAREMPMFWERIQQDLDPKLSPTEWRRAATSLAAAIAVMPEEALPLGLSLLHGRLIMRDPGIATALTYGIARASEVEPDASASLLSALVSSGHLDALEAVAELRHEVVTEGRMAEPFRMALARLQSMASGDDDGRAVLARCLQSELVDSPPRRGELSLRRGLRQALAAYVDRDAPAACLIARDLLLEATVLVDHLEDLAMARAEDRQTSFRILRELDAALLESSALPDLLLLGASAQVSSSRSALQVLVERIAAWMLRQESNPVASAPVPHLALRLQRFRAFLHLVDADVFGEERDPAVRDRKSKTVRVLLDRVKNDAPCPLRRIVCATLARAIDSLLRDETADLPDLLFATLLHVRGAEDLETLAEASMDPAAEQVLRGAAALLRRTGEASTMGASHVFRSIEALLQLVRALPVVGTPRVDALRDALARYASSCQALLQLRSLEELSLLDESHAAHPLSLASSAQLLSRLGSGSRRRLGFESSAKAGLDSAIRLVDVALEQFGRDDGEALRRSVDAASSALEEQLPAALAAIGASSLMHLVGLPWVAEAAESPAPESEQAPRTPPLPAWLPPSRTIGGFYVLRRLGSGGVGSVFVVSRAEERSRRGGERFALKVPEFAGDMAGELSESEFLRMFREEAGALLAVHDHPNLARLVTFDAGARPKPILVMELVEGPTLQRAIDTGALDVPRVIGILDGVAAGLEAMHAAGVGHLDLKPSNVILRPQEPEPKSSLSIAPGLSMASIAPSPASIAPGMLSARNTARPAESPAVPVLVDFGLAGRNIRRGCATVQYGAPEIWGQVPEGVEPRPMEADVYAFGCLVYEAFTGRELFGGPTTMAVIAKHVCHDGDVDGLRELLSDPLLAPLGVVIRGAVRKDPRSRATLPVLRAALATIAPQLSRNSWPVRAAVQNVREANISGMQAPPVPAIPPRR